MINVNLLEADDTIAANDWCRPLNIVSMSGGASDSYSFKSCYSGTPENNTKWVQVKHVMGACWIGSRVSEYTKDNPYEFLRGTPPKEHQLNMGEYNSLDSMTHNHNQRK